MANTAHKSATSVTLAPLQEKSQFELLVQQYWKHAAAVTVVGAIAVVVLHQRSQATKAERQESWNTVVSRATLDPFTRALKADPSTWNELATTLKGRDAGPWARLMQAKQLVDDRKYDEAKAALAQLRTDYPGHPLLQSDWRWSEDDKGGSLIDVIEKRLAERAAWETSKANLFANPPPESSDPRVVFKTTKGDFTVAVYTSNAPQHAAKFLELVDAKHFDGMAVHEVAAGQSIDLGDPNTKGEDTATWGQGGRDIVLPTETTGLHHFAGALSALAGAEPKQSLPSRVSILVSDNLFQDDTRVVFGVVESGLDIARQIAAAETDPSVPRRPKDAIRILSAARQ